MRVARRSAAARRAPIRRTAIRRWALGVLVVLARLPVGAAAQAGAYDEAVQLHEARRLEAGGEMAESERALRGILERRPESVPALLALERVLRIQGRLDELPPLVDRALAVTPGSAMLHGIRLRTLSALDRTAELEAAGAAWIRESPDLETPYREVARTWAARGDHGRAREVLEAGRRRIGDDALALELGDLHADLGDPTRAAEEWTRAVSPDGRGAGQLRRRLRSLPDHGAGVAGPVLDALSADPAAVGRVDAGLDLAVSWGLEDRALALAGSRLGALAPAERRRRLVGIARAAEAGGHARLAYWAYARLLDGDPGSDPAEAVARMRLAALANELGDRSWSVDTPPSVAGDRDTAGEEAARIEARARKDPDGARAALERFREERPDAPELDALTAAVAEGLLRADRDDEAARLLAREEGPRSSLLRARLLLEAGSIRAARTAYIAAAAGLRGAEATDALSLASLLGRLTPEAGALVGSTLRLRDTDGPGAAVDRALLGVDDLDPDSRPAVLGFAARLADGAGLPDEARELRRRIIADHPRSPEAPAALLELARSLARDEATHASARELLERLILEYPTSALVPQARRALEGLDRGGAS